MDGCFTLYFYNHTLVDTNVLEIEVCMAMEEVVDTSNIIGCQKIKNTWKLFLKNEITKLTIMQNGLNIRNQKVDVFCETGQSKRADKPVKVTIKDIPISVKNESIEKCLKDLGVTLKSLIKFARLRDTEGQLTPYINGDRFVYVEPTILDRPIPRFILIGSFVARIFHTNQKTEASCNKCLSLEHPTWQCTGKLSCVVCKTPGHLPGSIECQFYIDDNNAYTFGGRKDPLRFSNFDNCKFVFRDTDYSSREQAFQHQRSLASGQHDLANQILNTKTGLEAKQLSKCIIDKNPWSTENFDLMTEICLCCAEQSETYRSNIVKTENRLLVESISKQYVWSSGLTHEQTKHTRADKFPGKNQMGIILMNVRDQLKNNTNTSSSKPCSENEKEPKTKTNSHTQKPALKRKPSGTPPGSKDRKYTDLDNLEQNSVNNTPLNPLYEDVG